MDIFVLIFEVGYKVGYLTHFYFLIQIPCQKHTVIKIKRITEFKIISNAFVSAAEIFQKIIFRRFVISVTQIGAKILVFPINRRIAHTGYD